MTAKELHGGFMCGALFAAAVAGALVVEASHATGILQVCVGGMAGFITMFALGLLGEAYLHRKDVPSRGVSFYANQTHSNWGVPDRKGE